MRPRPPLPVDVMPRLRLAAGRAAAFPSLGSQAPCITQHSRISRLAT